MLFLTIIYTTAKNGLIWQMTLSEKSWKVDSREKRVIN